jgi:hypothetical protein
MESAPGSHRRRLTRFSGAERAQSDIQKNITVGLVPTVTGLVSNRSWRRASPLIHIQTEVS